MDTRDGSIHKFSDNKALAAYLEETNGTEADIVPVEEPPKPECKRCKGTGRERAGANSKRWKPCRCTYTIQDHKKKGFDEAEKEMKARDNCVVPRARRERLPGENR